MITMEQARASAKARDAWWTVLLVDPLALRLVAWSARHRWITPNRLTAAAFLITLGAAAAFWAGSWPWLVAGALAYHVAFVLDCMDGKLARLTGTGSVFGQWLDFMLDRIAVTICAVALFGGQYRATGETLPLVLGAVVVFLNLFHQLNGQIMESALRRARLVVANNRPENAGQPGTELGRGGWFTRLRAWLGRHRIRADVFSAIEFQMAVFIVGPIVHRVGAVTIAACALLVAFEAAAVVKFGLTARALQRPTHQIRPPAQPRGPVPPHGPIQPSGPAGDGPHQPTAAGSPDGR